MAVAVVTVTAAVSGGSSGSGGEKGGKGWVGCVARLRHQNLLTTQMAEALPGRLLPK